MDAKGAADFPGKIGVAKKESIRFKKRVLDSFDNHLAGARWAARAGVLLLLGFFAVAVFSVIERARREKIEMVVEAKVFGDSPGASRQP